MMELQYPEVHDISEVPMSRTHQYRKVMKPLLERKRRARINKCLDDLKDLMVDALQSEGESITKLEKADVLELTVRHLRKLKEQQRLQSNPKYEMDQYLAGFGACANEVNQCLISVPAGVNLTLGNKLMTHLGLKLKTIEQANRMATSSPLTVSVQQRIPQPELVNHPAAANTTAAESLVKIAEPISMVINKQPLTPTTDGGYSSGRESISPRSIINNSPVNFVKKEIVDVSPQPQKPSSSETVWRPF